MATPKMAVVKRLFAVSGNQCAFPGCDLPVSESTDTTTGEMAHIKAVSKNGPRYDKDQTEEERHAYANLILLCSRHHSIIDTEVDKYPVATLQSFKKNHEQTGMVEISPSMAKVAKALLQKYQNIVINNNQGQVAVNSPGAIQAETVNLKTTKSKVTFTPPEGSVASNLSMSSYTEYLIAKYKDFQKLDTAKEGKRKYTLIYNAIKREFKCKWQLVPATHFESLVRLLQRRIDNSKIGRIRKSRGQKSYHSYAEHLDI